MSEDAEWLARRLPDYDLSQMQTPAIEILSQSEFERRQQSLLGHHGRHEQIEALYDRDNNAIIFRDDLTELTPGMRALLAHEMTHAAQAASGNWTNDREYEGYRVQQDWRRDNGLPHEFPEDIQRSLTDIDRRYGIERSPAQRGLYRDGEMGPERRQENRLKAADGRSER